MAEFTGIAAPPNSFKLHFGERCNSDKHPDVPPSPAFQTTALSPHRYREWTHAGAEHGEIRGVAIRVCVEQGDRLVFASALDWPGWCRPGRSEQQALEALAAYAGRYCAVLRAAALGFEPESTEFDVLERAPGNATTDFGAPAIISEAEREPLDAAAAARLAAVVAGCWPFFDRVTSDAPALLRKGPRGGGRDRDEIVDHVAAAELAYARKLGIRNVPDAGACRVAIVEVLAAPCEGSAADAKGWPPRYGARRIGWHVLDHAWEIEDRS